MESNTKLSPEDIHNMLTDMINSPHKLSIGHRIFAQYETTKGFYSALLANVLNGSNQRSLIKLSSSVLKNYLTKNWGDENFIGLEEKIEIFSVLTLNIHHSDYFLKNFIAKLLGIISAKEWPNSYDVLIKKILKGLVDSKDNPIATDTYLTILISILQECDDRIAQMTSELMPIVIETFKNSTTNQKNREKCLKILTQLLNKLSFADGTDPDLVIKSLDSNKCIEQCLSLFISVLIANPKHLFDIKKYAIRTLDILVRDMPIYSSSFFTDLIEPAWRILVYEMTLYCQKVIFNEDIEYTETEIQRMNEEGYNYSRGYESEDEEEVYGIEGLVQELIDLAIDLLKRNGVLEALQDHVLTLFLCLKGYCLMPNQSILLWKNDPNLFISEEYDDENVNSIRSKAISLIRDVVKEIDDSIIIRFVGIILSEFNQGIDPENYLEVIKLDDYNSLFPFFDKLNNDSAYIQRRHEANLLILGSLSEDLMAVRDKKKISNEEIDQLVSFIFEIITKNRSNSILVGRALWCISKLISLIKHNIEFVIRIYEGVCQCLLEPAFKNDLSVLLIAIQCLTQINDKLPANYQYSYTENVFEKLIELLKVTYDETLSLIITGIISLSKRNKALSVIVPLKASKTIIEIYSQNYNHPVIGSRILQLIRAWCEDERTSKIMVQLFVPFSIYVFEDFFKNLKAGDKKAFEDVKKTVMTEHGGADLEFKTSLDMLPNLIDIITILTKYCVSVKDNENLNWISLISSVIGDILLKSNDVQILQRGTSFFRFYVSLCSESAIKKNQIDLIGSVISKMLADTDTLESSLLYVGNLTAQYFLYLQKKIETSILETIVRRTYRFKMPSVVQSMVLVYSRLFLIYPQDIFKFLTQFTIENRLGLKVLIDKWLLHQPLFRGKYFKNISIKALTLLFSVKDPIIETLMVIGYDPSHSNASIEVNAPFKILSVLIRCLHKEIMQEKLLKGEIKESQVPNDYINNEEQYQPDQPILDVNVDEFYTQKDYDYQTKELNSKLNFISVGKAGGLNNVEAGSEIYLSEMLVFDYNDVEADDEDNVEEDLQYLNDIDINFVLKDFLLTFFQKFKDESSEYLIECLMMLPRKDQDLFASFQIK